MPFQNQLNLAYRFWRQFVGVIYHRRIFGTFGKGSVLYPPMMLSHPQFIYIGDNVTIRNGARLEAVPLDPKSPPQLHIGNNVNIEQDAHIVFMGKVRIHDNVSITARCSILCGTHPYFNVHSPVKIGDRLSGKDSVIEIGEGSFIGIGSAIQMNVRLGKRVVVGTNSVVKKSVPDYTVVEGNPAVAVLQYDATKDLWLPCKSK